MTNRGGTPPETLPKDGAILQSVVKERPRGPAVLCVGAEHGHSDSAVLSRFADPFVVPETNRQSRMRRDAGSFVAVPSPGSLKMRGSTRCTRATCLRGRSASDGAPALTAHEVRASSASYEA